MLTDTQRGNYSEAAEHFKQAIAVLKDVGDKSGYVGPYKGLANMYEFLDMMDESKHYLKVWAPRCGCVADQRPRRSLHR